MYAIVEAGGEQIRVSPGETVKVNRIQGEVNSEVILDKVLVVSKDEGTVIGKPYVQGAQVKAEIVGEGKNKKVIVFKHQSKKAQDKKTGHRQIYTSLKINEIIGG
jgi:large subunit ribosomal protein L21